MKVGDLVRLKNQGNGQPGVGIIYEHVSERWSIPERTDEFRCLWDIPHWNSSFYFERELEVVNENA